MKKVLITGGSGRLGTELKKLQHLFKGYVVWFPRHSELDITKPIKKDEDVALVIHAAAYTDVLKAETDMLECHTINVLGTENLYYRYLGVPFVYISSEYANNPVNYYAKTKMLAEKTLKGPSLILRTFFKPRPYPYPRAFVDQWTQGDYVDVIAKLIVKSVMKWDKETRMIEYIGTGRKTVYDLARQTVPDIKKARVRDIKGVKLPKDYL